MIRTWGIPASVVLIGIVLIVVKLLGGIDSSWWLVCAPFAVIFAAIGWAAAMLPMPTKKTRLVICVERETSELAAGGWHTAAQGEMPDVGGKVYLERGAGK
jgi:hypothetical protein